MLRNVLLALLFVPALVLADDPRGVRNHNPGNIIQTDIDWHGEVDTNTDGKFEQFTSAEYGIRAMVVNLFSYQNVYQLHTTRDIMHRWAPLYENPEGYHDYVIEYAGEGGSLLDQEYLFNLIKAIIYYENGYHPYKDSTIKRVIKEYLTHD